MSLFENYLKIIITDLIITHYLIIDYYYLRYLKKVFTVLVCFSICNFLIKDLLYTLKIL